MNWRIYRLPGSRQAWHVDNGPDTQIVNVIGFEFSGIAVKSVDIGCGYPRAWIEVPFDGTELHIIDGVATWRKFDPVCEKQNNNVQQTESQVGA